MKSLARTEARDHPKDRMSRVNEDHVPARIWRRNGKAPVLMSDRYCAGLQETLCLLGNSTIGDTE